MIIVHSIFSFNVGGAESLLVDILNYQAAEHQVHLIVINDSYDKELLSKIDNRVHCHFMRRKSGAKSPLPFIMMNFRLWRIRPDILHLHQASLLSLFIAPLKTRKILTLHTLGITSPHLQRADAVVSISQAVQNDIHARYGLHSKVISNGIRCSDIRAKQLNSHSPFRVLQVGRFDVYKKGCDVALKAIALLKQRGIDVSFTMIGDGAGRDEIESLIQELGIESSVILLGQRSREYIYESLADYDLLIQPSRFEGFGLTVAEGLAANIPVLVSDIDGPIEIIDHGLYGYFFRSDNVAECAYKIKEIIENYDEAMQKAQHGYQHAYSTYDIKQMVEKYLDIYNKVLSR